MAKFCIHCGRKLEDGEICTCQVKVQSKKHNIGPDILDVLKGMFVKPIDTIKKYTDEKYLNLAFIFTGVLALVAAIFMLSFVKNISSLIYSASIYSMFSLQIPYLQIFFITLLTIIIYTLVYVGFLYLVNSVIFKGDKSIKKVFIMYGINSIILSVALLVSAILMFVSGTLGLVILMLGSALNMLYTYRGIEYLGVKDKNKHGYIYLLTTVFCVVLLLIVSMFLNMFSNNGYHHNNSYGLTESQQNWIQDNYGNGGSGYSFHS